MKTHVAIMSNQETKIVNSHVGIDGREHVLSAPLILESIRPLIDNTPEVPLLFGPMIALIAAGLIVAGVIFVEQCVPRLEYAGIGIVFGTGSAQVIVAATWSALAPGNGPTRRLRSCGGLMLFAVLAGLGALMDIDVAYTLFAMFCVGLLLCVPSIVLQLFLVPVSAWRWRLMFASDPVNPRDMQFNTRHLLWTMLVLGIGLAGFRPLLGNSSREVVTVLWMLFGGISIAAIMLVLCLRAKTLTRAIAFPIVTALPWFAFSYGIELTGLISLPEANTLMIADVHAVIAGWALLYGILWRQAGLRLVRQRLASRPQP